MASATETKEKEYEKKMIAALERYYTEETDLTLARAASDAGVQRIDVVYYMADHKLYPETEDPIRSECLERLLALKNGLNSSLN